MSKAILSSIIMALFLNSCVLNKREGNLKKVTYTSKFQIASIKKPFEKRSFTLLIPRGYIVKKDFNPEYKEVVYKYKNGSIYITDNNITGSDLNGKNKLANGITFTQRTSLQDSIYMKGQNNNLYWKENILNDIVIGYLDVPKEHKKLFDKALESLKRR